MDDLIAYADEIADHLNWLKNVGDELRIARFQQQLATQPETAISEVCLRKWLERQGYSVEPTEDRTHGGPDFKVNREFYIECTCITREAATNGSEMPHLPEANHGAFNYRQLTDNFKNECVGKAAQCAKVNDLPCLLAICTLHFQAGALCFNKRAVEFVLTSQPMISQKINMRTGMPVGDLYQSTDLRSSVFVRPAKKNPTQIEAARQSISALLLCPFGTSDPDVVGVLHAEAMRPFNRQLLQTVPFCRLKDGYDEGVFEVEWI